MGKRPISSALTVLGLVLSVVALPAIAQTTLPPGGTFIDDDGNSHEGAIEAISAAGITSGCGSAIYCPSRPVTRAEMAVFLIRALGESPASHTAAFADVPAGQWYTGYVERIAQLGIATGYGDGTYRPHSPISRAEMAVLLMRALGLQPASYKGSFSDVPNGQYYTGAVERILAEGVTAGCGNGRYCPFNQVLRDQMATFVARAFDLALMVPPARFTTLALAEVESGFDQPVFLASPPGDSRLFVVDQPGRIWIIQNGSTLSTPFLDIRGAVAFGGEQGLLGLAFHPDYATNHRFFVNYTDNSGDTQILEYQASSNANVANLATARTLLSIDQPAANHNGGWLGFGPDHLLYIGMGDGGGGNDQFGNGQNPTTLLGKILRMNVDQATPGAEIWVKGVRNPWRNAWDGNNLYVADVGQNAREEVTILTTGSGGANLGWPIVEGTGCLGGGSCNKTGLTPPIYEYTHASGGCSITGGYVYRGNAIPELAGTYFFGDYCAGWVRSFRYTGSGVADVKTWTALGDVGNITSFGVDAAGEIYLTVIDGRVLKVVRG